MASDRGPTRRVAFFGAPLDSGNRGVEALGLATLDGIMSADPTCAVTLFDNGWGVRTLEDEQLSGRVDLCGVRNSRRLHRPESWTRVVASQRLHLPNPVADRIKAADVVMDISGGDSFADVYGPRRLQSVLAAKRAALRAGRPLVLLPQTYGPYIDPSARRAATSVLRRATMAWSRDDDSHAVLLDLLGSEADPTRHRVGVDVAFALTPADPGGRLPRPVRDLLTEDRNVPVVGVNVSGLLVDGRAAERFGLALDYRRVTEELVTTLLSEGARVVLVPHVRDQGGAGESDIRAAQAVLDALPVALAERVLVAPDDLSAREVKWVISRCDWFCGARMHATIAALSTAVPVAAVAYSMKFRGVFATCGVEDLVVEARSVTTDEAVAQLLHGFRSRDSTRRRLDEVNLAVAARARDQLHDALAVAGTAVPR